MASVEERNKASIVRFYDEIINQGNVAVVDELMEPNFVHYGETLFPRIEGSEAIKAGVLGVKNAYPDGHTVVEDMVAEGDTVVCLLSWRGTHRGPFMGIPPTGRVSTWIRLPPENTAAEVEPPPMSMQTAPRSISSSSSAASAEANGAATTPSNCRWARSTQAPSVW